MCLILRPVFITLSLRHVIALNFFFTTKKSANRPLCPLHSYRTQLSFSRVQHFIYYTWTTNFVNYFLYPGIRIFIPRYSGFSRFSVFYCILFLHMRILFHYLPRNFFAFFIVFPCFSSIIITCVFHFYNFHSYIHPKKFYHFYRNKKKSPEKPDAMSCVRGHFHTASGENFSLFSI